MPDLAVTELCNRLRGVSAEQLMRLEPEELRAIEEALSLERSDRLDELCAQKVVSFDAGPLFWLTTLTKTNNPKHELQGLPYQGPFPKKPYFVPLFQEFLNLEARARESAADGPIHAEALFIAKCREMLTSWSAVGYAVWRAEWHRYDVLFQTGSLDKAGELVDYASQLWRNQEEWLKARYPLTTKEPTTFELSFAGGGRVMAIPGGADKVRLFHPTLLVMDEAAFLPEAEESFNAALPVCHEILAISTASPGWFGDEVGS